MKILALDLGAHMGWAVGDNSVVRTAGTVHFLLDAQAKEQRMDRRCDPRFLKFHDWLQNLHFQNRFDWVVFEDVQFVKSRMQAHLWASWRAAVWLLRTQVDCVPTNVLKQFAGNGNADKEYMARALARRDKRFRLDGGQISDTLGGVIDDNAVDAIWLLKWAQANFR